MSATSLSLVVGHPGVEPWNANEATHRRKMAAVINRLNRGQFNCTLDVTLLPNTGATIIADNRIGSTSAVTPLMAMSLSAALAIAAGIWCDAPMAQVAATTASIVVHHNISSEADKIIRFGIVG